MAKIAIPAKFGESIIQIIKAVRFGQLLVVIKTKVRMVGEFETGSFSEADGRKIKKGAPLFKKMMTYLLGCSGGRGCVEGSCCGVSLNGILNWWFLDDIFVLGLMHAPWQTTTSSIQN